jgi:hypothetical protein
MLPFGQRQMRGGHVYQRQLASVTAAGSSRSRSPTPPLPNVSVSSVRSRSPAVPPPPLLHISTTANHPYHHTIMAHIRQSSAVVPRMPTCSFNDTNLVTPLDHISINLSAAGWKCPICFGMPRQPVAIMTCGHVGCDTCLHEWMVTKPSADLRRTSVQRVERSSRHTTCCVMASGRC